MTKDPHKDWTLKAWLAFALLLGAITVMLLGFGGACSVPAKKKVVVQPPVSSTDTGTDTEPVTCEGGLRPGQTTDEPCEGGQITRVCNELGELVEAGRSCRAPEPTDSGTGTGTDPTCGAQATTFAALQPILRRNCAGGCHVGKDTFEAAVANADDWLERVELPRSAAQHMPKGSDLTEPEKQTLRSWIDDGRCPEPSDGGGDDQAFRSFSWFEQQMLSDITGAVQADDRPNTRWLVSLHRLNAAAAQGLTSSTDEPTWRAAAAKSINSLTAERELVALREVVPGIYRIDLDELGLTPEDWDLIEAADEIDIESLTNAGGLLKLITGTQKPWMQVEVFNEVALRDSDVYYALTRTPATFQELAVKLGVDYAADLLTRTVDPINRPEAALAAFVGSPLSPHNRMVSWHESRDGSLFCTYDTGARDTAEKNFTQFPLLFEVGGALNAQFVAGECIYTLPNGLHGYALFAAEQTFGTSPARFVRSELKERQNAAPVDVVTDFESARRGLGAEIVNANSCFRCHAGGMLPFADQLRDQAIANGSTYGADRDKVLAVYKGNAEWERLLGTENARYRRMLTLLEVEGGDEPISTVSDHLRTQWDLEKVAAFLWLQPGDLRVLINQSERVKAQVGQLLSGGTITFDQLVASLPVLKEDLRLFQDPIE